MFKTWKIQVDTQIRKHVKYLRTDNCLEFCNDNFNQYCRMHGITGHRIVANTSQQNGLVERMNTTLLERVRCMLSDAMFP